MKTLEMRENAGVPYLAFPLLEGTGMVIHAFSTRQGGVSQNEFAAMNFASNRGDDPALVQENYRRMAAALGVAPEQMVLSQQTHTTNLRAVSAEDAGKGVTRERDYMDIDGLVTNVPGLVLVTSYADCVPLYFVDPVNKAIGLSHSGWKGTVGRIGEVTIQKMQELYGSDPGDILACIGPSICRDCYEVSQDVAEKFQEIFPQALWERIMDDKGKGKYQLDLWESNRLILLEAGIREEHLAVTDLCTCCNPELLFSHRATQGKRGNLAAFLGLR